MKAQLLSLFFFSAALTVGVSETGPDAGEKHPTRTPPPAEKCDDEAAALKVANQAESRCLPTELLPA